MRDRNLLSADAAPCAISAYNRAYAYRGLTAPGSHPAGTLGLQGLAAK